MWPWAVRWQPAQESVPAQPARHCEPVARPALPHLVAERLGYDLVDATYSGATTANVLRERQHGAPPQVDVLDGSEHLVTVTIGGNDVGYVPLLFAATAPRAAGRPCASCSTLRSANAHWPTSGHRCERSAT